MNAHEENHKAETGILDDNVFIKSGAHGRQNPAVEISVPVVYQIENTKKSWWSKSLSLAETGIRLTMAQKVTIGTVMSLTIKLPNMQEDFKVKGAVVWVRPAKTANLWECGVAFENLKHVSKKEKMIALIADQHCRFALMFTKDYTAQPIDSPEIMQQAYQVLYKEYLKKGYCDQNQARMHYNFYSLLPTSFSFSLTNKTKFLGTISIIGDSPCGLPMETIFAAEINTMRQQGRKLVEIGFLALNSSEFKKGFFSLTNFKKQASLFRLYKIIYDYSRAVLGTTDFIIGVHPKHETLYKYIGFESFGPVRAYPGAEDNLALPLRLDLIKFAERMSTLKTGIGPYFHTPGPVEALKKRMVWPKEVLVSLLLDKKAMWNDLKPDQRAFLEQSYPGLTAMVTVYKTKQKLVAAENMILEGAKNLKTQFIKQIDNFVQSENRRAIGIGLIHDDHLNQQINVPVLYEIAAEGSEAFQIPDFESVSKQEMRITTAQKLNVGTQLHLEIKLPTKNHLITKGEVIWVKPSANAGFWDCDVSYEKLKHVSQKEILIFWMADQCCRISSMLTKDYVTQPIDKLETMYHAYQIIYKTYIMRGYCRPNKSKMHYHYHLLLPHSCTFSLVHKEKLMGTVSIIGDSPAGLPLDAIFANEINSLREQKRVVAEACLVSLNDFSYKSRFLMFPLYKIIADYARLVLDVTDLIVAARPKDIALYKYLGFELFGPVRNYPGAESQPVSLLKLDFAKFIEQNKNLRFGDGYFLKNETPVEILFKKMVWSNEVLADLLVGKKELWDNLKPHQRRYFEQCYPGLSETIDEYKTKHIYSPSTK